MSVVENHDIKIVQSDTDYVYDIGFDDDGDLLLDDTFNVNILMSLFVDSRAQSSHVPEPIRRRGFWGDLVLFKNDNDISSGSLLWLAHGRLTENTKNRAIDAVEKSLNWLVSRDYAKEVRVDGDYTTNGIVINVTIVIDDNSIKKFNFKLWENGIVQEVTKL